LNRALRCICLLVVLAAVAGVVAGCADSRMAANNAGSSAGEVRPPAPYKTGYGFSSDGPTTDLYTELFRPKPRDDTNAPAAVSSGAVQQGQPTSAPGAVRQGPAVAQTPPVPAPGAVRQGSVVAQAPPASSTARQGSAVAQAAPAPAPGGVQQQPAEAPAPPPTPTAYGIPSDGPTTDLFTELFGRRNQQ
jgi:hypothetical protein